ncbi:formimidoylglutamate deiminase [Dermacoccaceae bacterium W4C1]
MSGIGQQRQFWAAFALDVGGLARDVTFTVGDDGRFLSVTPDTRPGAAHQLPGVVIPGLANCHSHAFHRALRGRTHADGGTFWTWRTGMYEVAAQLDPVSYLNLARAVYAEMALAGITAVGEFHYLHHAPAGRRYADPNAMSEALRQAAADAGLRLTLLDTCYLAGGLTSEGHTPLAGPQLRFGDADVEAWASRRAGFAEDANTRRGAAIHSVRAVPQADLLRIRDLLDEPDPVVHAHVSEQPAENEAALAHYGRTPVALLAEASQGWNFSAVHATHLTDADIDLLARGSATACFCPTTERDLADGIGPAARLHQAGVPLSLGSDQHAIIDLFEEARALEMHERLASLHRGRFAPAQLMAAATAHGSLGWEDAGSFAVGARADLVAVRSDSVRTAGGDPAQILLAANAADVDTVVRDGEIVVQDQQHRLGDVGRMLSEAIDPLRRNA